MFRDAILQALKRAPSASSAAILDNLLLHACEIGASDIHLDPTENGIRVRCRIDGILHDEFLLSQHLHAALIGRLKVMCGIRTDEHILPQDGRLKFLYKSLPVDARVSIIATHHGENAVIRILQSASHTPTLENLGFAGELKDKLRAYLSKNSGMILVTGPTGSGKTTTLYAFLETVARHKKLIVTIEDPVEYALPGIRQIQTQSARGLTFAMGLRSILRQDPDVVMVGEIRDSETAKIAVNAALTGHLILTTLHTRNAASALPRLLDMGVDPYLIASTVDVIIAQRLAEHEGMTTMLTDGLDKASKKFTSREEILSLVQDGI